MWKKVYSVFDYTGRENYDVFLNWWMNKKTKFLGNLEIFNDYNVKII